MSSEDKTFYIDFVVYLSPQGEMLRIRSRVHLRSVFAEPAYSERCPHASFDQCSEAQARYSPPSMPRHEPLAM